MRIFDEAFAAQLESARQDGIAPAYFVWVVGKNRDDATDAAMGFWTGHENITETLLQADGLLVSREYIGGCGLSVENLQYVADLTDEAVSVSLSQIADAVQQLIRGYDVRLGYVEIHATSWTGGVLASVPQLQWVGVVDEVTVQTPAAGSEGGITLSVRSEIMWQLTATNPAKSSDSHQKRRRENDRFSEYAAVMGSRRLQWYQG